MLTLEEARDALRIDGSDNDNLIQALLDSIGPYLLAATGHDWAADTTIHPLDKSVAVFLLQEWYFASTDNKVIGAGASTRQLKAIDSLLVTLTIVGRTYGT